MKIVINKCFGGFGLSPLATKMAVEAGVPCDTVYPYDPKESFHFHHVELESFSGGWKVFGPPGCKPGLFVSVVKGGNVYSFHGSEIALRSHPELVKIVRRLGAKANGPCAKLGIVTVPDGVEVDIHEYDGNESIHESHRVWR